MLELAISCHIVAVIITTIVVLYLDYSARPQAIAQILVALLVPLLGPVIVLIFQSVVHRNMTTKLEPDSQRTNANSFDDHFCDLDIDD